MPVSWARSSWPPVDVPASNVPVLIYTAHTTHSKPSTPLTVRFHSNAMPQLTRFSCLRAALARQDLLANHPGRRDPWFVLPAS